MSSAPGSVTRRRFLTALGLVSGGLALGPSVTEAVAAPAAGSSLLVGRGISDITGAAAENGMMGYSLPTQQTTGIHQRLRARAFVVADGSDRIAWCCTDQGILPIAVHQAVLGELAERFGEAYTERNVSLTATHTHAGPAGCSHHLAYNLASLGFKKQTFDAVVAGIVEAISAAHADLAPGSIVLGRGELRDASVNRSRTAFDLNPQPDKDVFPQAIDPSMTVFRLSRGGRDVGAITWFPTHGTSMTNTNTLISGDNKGYAAYAWEHDQEGVRYLDDAPGFVAAFPQTNAGDMSPNLGLVPGGAPTDDEFENTRTIGERQFAAARQIHADAAVPIEGGLDSRMCWVDFSAVRIEGRYTPDGQPHRTSPGLIGVSTLAGSTEDGPGIPGLFEGTPSPLAPLVDPIDVAVPGWLADQQSPKTPAVPSGLVGATPNILPLQLLRIGRLHLACAPAELTIVSGLRIRRTVAAELGVPLEDVLVQSYSNGYSQYVATPEEYDSQQYEGASTLFGRYTLPAYQQEFARLAASMRDRTTLPPGPAPTEPPLGTLDVQPGVVADSPGLSREFGQVLTDAEPSYRAGRTVTVEFVTGHPKNDLHRRGTFLEVQRQDGGGWTRHLDDGDWATRYRWKRTNPITGESTATITWDIAAGTPPGSYRIQHLGDARNGLTGVVSTFTGTSRPFIVT